MSEMIERVARAGYECSEWGHKQSWDQNPWAQAAWRKCAREMIQAMREPTEAMLDHFAGTPWRYLPQSKQEAEVNAYRAMIDAAIDGAGR